MACKECYIGMWVDYDSTDLCTLEDLMNNSKYSSFYTIHDYLDRRKSVNLIRFNFCPMCGKVIDYTKMRKELNK